MTSHEKIFKSFSEIQFYKSKNAKQLLIGKGAFSEVCLIYHRDNPERFYALKKMHKKDATEIQYIKREIEVHKNLSHPNIIKFFDYFEKGRFFYCILEYAAKGDLFDYLKKKLLPKNILMKLFYQICNAVKHLHDNDIMHRDIKPENIFLDENLNAKLGDFGWSAFYKENERRKSLCGTFEYMPPEVY